jgi:hypothetical protein
MNIAALKTFAPAVRRQLMEAVTLKLDFVLAAQTPDYLATFAPQVRALRQLAAVDRPGLIERVAYTWFNRLTALRYLDARSWHPFRAKVLMPASDAETLPEIFKLTQNRTLPTDLLSHTKPERLDELLDARIPSPNPQGEVYRELILAACRFYHSLMPNLFERIDDETELLLPDDLLTEQSIAERFRTGITDEDCSEVELIGWLYQFYISEKKDAVMARKAPVPTEDLPAVTQLFTPHWIVRYLVENSLGRVWLLNRSNSRLRSNMRYYVESDPVVEFVRVSSPEDIRFIDPAVGSGHMLTYAFELLFAIYEEEGYAPADIPGLILRNNLYGLDIDPRASQLACLALALKAREKTPRFFQAGQFVEPQVVAFQNVSFDQEELRDYVQVAGFGDLFNASTVRLLHQFEEAKNFGSLIEPAIDKQQIEYLRGVVSTRNIGTDLFLRQTHAKVLTVLNQACLLTERYHAVVSNPPYQERNDMNASLREYVHRNFRDGETDLCCAFILRNQKLADVGGLVGMITMQSWMFLDGSVNLRKAILPSMGLASMLHLGPRAFDAIPGEVVQTTAFIFGASMAGRCPIFHRLVEGRNEHEKEAMFLDSSRKFESRIISDLRRIPGFPLAYWATDAEIRAFSSFPSLGTIAEPCQGLITGSTAQFLRYWHEVSFSNLGLGLKSRLEASNSGRKWFPQDKGGPPRRWYGNNDFVVNWKDDGEEIRNFRTPTGRLRSRPQNMDYYFRPGVTWTKISSGDFGCRFTPAGFIFSDAGMKLFHSNENELLKLAGFLNSRVADRLLGCLSETINYEQGNVARLPVAPVDGVSATVTEMVDLARDDWDSRETSWNFSVHPFLRPTLKGPTVESTFLSWAAQCANALSDMKRLDIENNRCFINAYGLHDELTPEVTESQITLSRANAQEDVADFLSYSIGCMMGRYSLDTPGLIIADGTDTLESYLAKTGKQVDELIFAPDEDGVIPILDEEWFANDVVSQFKRFLKASFGESKLQDNIRFIENSLGKDLRKYFLGDFYKDHLHTYKKRPIYWLIQSPLKSFSVLIYMHRYTHDTINVILNKYLREFQVKIRNHIVHLDAVQLRDGIGSRDKTAARREADKLLRALHECEAWERETMLPLAQARIDIDLDEGVKANYLRLGEALAPIPGLAATEE